MPVGVSPRSGDEVNTAIGTLLREFTAVKEKVGHNHNWLGGEDLKGPPYNLSADDETLIKSAIADLDTALDALDMTFINRLTGLF